MAEFDGAGDSRWTLTEEELGWCAELVAALAAENIMRPTPDLLLAQFAIVGKGDTEKLVERVKNYNKVIVCQYGYRTAADHAKAAEFSAGYNNRKWPGIFAPARPQLGGKSCVTMNIGVFRPATMENKEEIELCLADCLVLFECACHDLNEIRNGLLFVTQCSGLGWSNFSVEMEKLAAPMYDECYPIKVSDWDWMVDAPWIIKGMLKLCQMAMMKTDRVKVCSQAELYVVASTLLLLLLLPRPRAAAAATARLAFTTITTTTAAAAAIRVLSQLTNSPTSPSLGTTSTATSVLACRRSWAGRTPAITSRTG